MTDHLFCYGSLVLAPVMRAVCGQAPPSQPACLHDFACYALSGDPYPAIVPQAGATVSGRLYSRFRPAWLTALDRYEGQLYQRQRVRVHLAAGRSVRAWTYVLRMRYYHRCSRQRWSLEDFLRKQYRPSLYRL